MASDEALLRPLETGKTVADASEPERLFGWRAETSVADWMARMVTAQTDLLRCE